MRTMTVLEQAVASNKRKRPRTIANYLRAVRSFQAFAGKSLRGWTGAQVEAWRDSLTRQGLAPQSVNNFLCGLRFAVKRAEELGTLEKNFARGADFLYAVKDKKRYARPAHEAATYLTACRGRKLKDIRDFALFTLGFRTGLRRESLALLELEGIDGHQLTVVIKGGRQHKLTIDSDAMAAMKPWLDRLREHGIRSGKVFRAIDRHERIGKGLRPTAINEIMLRRSIKAGVRFHPHLMRHCFVSWAVAADVPTPRIMAMTGHKREDMIRLYTTDVQAEEDPVGNYLPKLGG